MGLPDPETTELELLLQKWEQARKREALLAPAPVPREEESPLPEPRREEPPLPEPREELLSREPEGVELLSREPEGVELPSQEPVEVEPWQSQEPLATVKEEEVPQPPTVQPRTSACRFLLPVTGLRCGRPGQAVWVPPRRSEVPPWKRRRDQPTLNPARGRGRKLTFVDLRVGGLLRVERGGRRMASVLKRQGGDMRLGQTSEEFLLDLAEKVWGAYPDSPIQDHLKQLSRQFLLGMTPQELNVRLSEDPKLTLLGALKVADKWERAQPLPECPALSRIAKEEASYAASTRSPEREPSIARVPSATA
ncbi:UNVERIFIED_CONTAM: hypothetical protein FKN15_056406 [Acipenser sinensis]